MPSGEEPLFFSRGRGATFRAQIRMNCLSTSSSNLAAFGVPFLRGPEGSDGFDEREELSSDVALKHRMIPGMDRPLAVRRVT